MCSVCVLYGIIPSLLFHSTHDKNFHFKKFKKINLWEICILEVNIFLWLMKRCFPLCVPFYNVMTHDDVHYCVCFGQVGLWIGGGGVT